MSEYHFYFENDGAFRVTSKISNEDAPADLSVNFRGEDLCSARLSAGHYIADLPENICQQLLFGMKQHYFVTKFKPSTDPTIPGIRRFKHILIY